MTPPTDQEWIAGELKYLRLRIDALYGLVDSMKSNVHTAGACPLQGDIHTLQMAEAQRKGAITVIGAIAGLVAGAVMSVVVVIVQSVLKR